MLEVLFINSNIRCSLAQCVDFGKFKLGASSKRAANAEMYVADTTNQTQKELWESQKEYDYQKWQEQNEYNTPANQVKRLQDAGINANLAMQNVTTGTAASSAGGQTPPTMTKPDIGNAIAVDQQNDISKVQNLALIGEQLSKIGKEYQETKSIEMQNHWLNAEKSLDIGRKTRDNALIDEGIKSAIRANKLGDASYDFDFDSRLFQSRLIERQWLNSVCQGSILEIEKDMKVYARDNLLPQQYQMNVRSMQTAYIQAVAAWKNAHANELNARTNANESKSRIEVNKVTALKAYGEFLNVMEDRKTKEFWNKVNEETKEAIGRKIIADSFKANAEMGKAEMDAFFTPFDAMGNFIPIFGKIR